ncbi:hypothetical protein R1sor_004736 [Riccia sorocarpa]|uniref:Uncharacterized protein n=1 Tax=Riccia sorocarpa TaxID=122646 RepID=A0ABD3HLW7_9MARC
MTFTRKTGHTRPVENEATVDVDVTRPKRNVKKTITVADIPSVSQRAGKKTVHEVDDEEVVDKERSNERPWLIKRYYKVDIISNVQWAYMKSVDISAAFAGISEFQLWRIGLKGVITRQFHSVKSGCYLLMVDRNAIVQPQYKPSLEEDLNDDTQVIFHEDVGSRKRRAHLKRPDVLEPEMQQRLLAALQTEDQMDVRLSEKKAELAELKRLVAEERCLLDETTHRRKEEERQLEKL